MGPVEVPREAYYGAQTVRSSCMNFAIGEDRLPRPMIRAYGVLKLCAARVNLKKGLLEGSRARHIEGAAMEVLRPRQRAGGLLR